MSTESETTTETVSNPEEGVQVPSTGGFSFDSFKDPSSFTPAPSQPTPEPDQNAPEPEPTPEPTPQVQIEAEGVKVPVQPDPTSPYPPQRDYSGIDEVDMRFFKRLPNDQFAHWRQRYDQQRKYKTDFEKAQARLAELEKTQAPKWALDHPNAWMLSQDFADISAEQSLIDQALGHMGEQLTKSRRGDTTWTPLSIDPQTGRLTTLPDKETSADAESKILQSISNLQALKYQSQGKLESLKGSFQDQRKGNVGKMTEWQQKNLGSFTENLDEAGKKDFETLKSGLPDFVKNSDFGDIVTHSLFAAWRTMQINNQLRKQLQTQKVNGSHQIAAGTVKTGATASTPQKSPWDMSDFDALKAAGRP